MLERLRERRNLPMPWAWFALLLVIGARDVAAVCPPGAATRAEGEAPFRYALALADSFAQAKAALAKAPADSPGGNSSSDRELTQLMGQLRSAAEDYRCAAELIAPYTRSGDEGVTLSARAAALTYDQLIRLDEEKRELIQSVMNGRVPRATLTARLDRGRTRTEETWRMLISATVMGTFALVQPPEQEDDRVSTLRITSQQRKTIADRIERDFGPAVRQEAKRGEAPLVGAARLLHGFVSNTDWADRDAQ